jgi:hypothetical protein
MSGTTFIIGDFGERTRDELSQIAAQCGVQAQCFAA